MGNSRFYTLIIKKDDVQSLEAIEAFSRRDASMDELMVEDIEDSEREGFVEIPIWFNLMDEKHPTKGFDKPLRSFMQDNKIAGELWEMEEYGGTESLIFSVE